MSPPRDPFKAEPGVSYSKGQVNRAGRLILRFVEAASDGRADSALAELGAVDVFDAFRTVTWWRSLHARPLSLVAVGLRYHVDKEGGQTGGRIDVTQRLKRRQTIIGKLAREPKMQVTQMQDIGGVRVRLPSLDHVHAVSRRLRKTWTIVRVRDYIAEPKRSGYRALHLIVRRDGYPIEVQLRTRLQDAWANQVEEDGTVLGVGLKFGAGSADIHAYYVAVSEAFALLDRGELLSDEVAATLKTRYAIIKDILPDEREQP